MDNNSTEESPIGNEEFEATKDDVADEGRNIDEVSLVSMICSSSNLHSAGSYRKSNENIRNFAASRRVWLHGSLASSIRMLYF